MLIYDNVIITTLLVNVIEPQSTMSLAISPIAATLGFPKLEIGLFILTLFSLFYSLTYFKGVVFLFDLHGLSRIIDRGRVFNAIKIIPDDAEYGDYFGASLVFPNNHTLFISSPYHQRTGE